MAAGVGGWFLAPAGWHEARLEEGAHLSFAQNGEDLIAVSLFRLLKTDRPSYLDIGAYEPRVGSNTYLFYRAGGRGVLVEPNVDLTAKLRSVRPGDTVLPVGVGLDGQSEADYFCMSLPQNNTFDRAEAEGLERETGGACRIVRTVKMPLVPVNAILAEHFGGATPDFLSIDVEGLDVAILKTLDFGRYRPAVVCVEHPADPTGRADLLRLMAGNGYTARGQTYANTLFVENTRAI